MSSVKIKEKGTHIETWPDALTGVSLTLRKRISCMVKSQGSKQILDSKRILLQTLQNGLISLLHKVFI